MKNILLICSAGMSTSIIVKKMLEAAKEKEIEVHIEAVGLGKVEERADEFDLFLLGPQIKYRKDEIDKVAEQKNKKVAVINTMDYGLMKGDKILEFALETLK